MRDSSCLGQNTWKRLNNLSKCDGSILLVHKWKQLQQPATHKVIGCFCGATWAIRRVSFRKVGVRSPFIWRLRLYHVSKHHRQHLAVPYEPTCIACITGLLLVYVHAAVADLFNTIFNKKAQLPGVFSDWTEQNVSGLQVTFAAINVVLDFPPKVKWNRKNELFYPGRRRRTSPSKQKAHKRKTMELKKWIKNKLISFKITCDLVGLV